MGFRTIEITNRCKLEYSLNYLIVRTDEVIKININEISTLIINSVSVSLTTFLLMKLCEANVKVIFCDEKRNPVSEVVPYFGTYNSYSKLKEQTSISDNIKGIVWKEIIKEKIINQSRNLAFVKEKEAYELLVSYICRVDFDDKTNREGHAAKVYFNKIFFQGFTRGSSCVENKFLNYGYSILLSAINRNISAYGYLNQLGIHHIGESNDFNLGCDLIEPLRPIIDSLIIKEVLNEDNFKIVLGDILNMKVSFKGSTYYLDNAIKLYVNNTLNVLKNDNIDELHFIKYEI